MQADVSGESNDESDGGMAPVQVTSPHRSRLAFLEVEPWLAGDAEQPPVAPTPPEWLAPQHVALCATKEDDLLPVYPTSLCQAEDVD